MKRFFNDLQQRVEAVPGVEAIGYIDLPPLSLAVSNADFYDADSAESRRAAGDTMHVSAHYFAASGISLLAGRDFDPQRDESAPVATINQAAAQRLFGEQDPIGRHIRVEEGRGAGTIYEVIGLVGNAKVETIGEGDVPCVFHYLSEFEGGFSLYGVTMIARSSGDPGQLAAAVQREITNLDRELPLFNVETLGNHIDEALLLPRVSGALFGLFGSVGLVLVLVGVYGVVNYSVRTRTREIGIRMAMGASSLSVARTIVNQGLALVGAGLATGLVVALMLSRFAASQLYGVSSKDPVTFVGVPLLLFTASMAALLIPACRAARIEPMTALRDE
jgi:putative ABC transport system permease protein